MKNNTLVLGGIIDGHNVSLEPIINETKPLNVMIGSHNGKVIFYVISF
jgi:hypothetical protein